MAALTPLYADGARSYLAYEAEVAFNTEPVAPALTLLRNTGNTLDLAKNTFLSDELRNDRALMELRHGNLTPAGDISFEFIHKEYDAFLAAAMGAAWTGGGPFGLIQGTGLYSFTIEKGFNDILEYFQFTGCVVNTFSLNFSPESMITGSIGFLCGDTELTQLSIDGAEAPPDTLIAAQTGSPYDSWSASFTESAIGGAFTYLTSLTLNINNGVTPNYVLASNEPIEMSLGRSNISGSFTCLFKDDKIWDAFNGETEVAIVIVINDPAATDLDYTFTLHRVKYTAASTPVSDDGSIIQTFDFQALYSTGDTSNMTVSRDDSA